jgi:hypothetical protein
MVRLVRHRQTKGPETDRPHLHHRATSRLHTMRISPSVFQISWLVVGGRLTMTRKAKKTGGRGPFLLTRRPTMTVCPEDHRHAASFRSLRFIPSPKGGSIALKHNSSVLGNLTAATFLLRRPIRPPADLQLLRQQFLSLPGTQDLSRNRTGRVGSAYDHSRVIGT